jgi:Flp pilus assembly protein TadD
LGKGAEAVKVGQQAAALKPDDLQVIGNLACAYLIAGRHPEAEKTIQAALKLGPEDPTNLAIQRMLNEVQSGARPQPQKLSDLTKPKS